MRAQGLHHSIARLLRTINGQANSMNPNLTIKLVAADILSMEGQGLKIGGCNFVSCEQSMRWLR